MRMLQLRCDLDLATETVTIHPGSQLRGKDLDHNLAAEPAVRGHEDATHPSAGKLALDVVKGRERCLELLFEACHRRTEDRTDILNEIDTLTTSSVNELLLRTPPLPCGYII